MPDLQAVVKALLNDFTTAQHKTNRLTRHLAQKYQGDAIMQHIPVPNAVIDEVELTLRFAVESVEETEGERLPSLGTGDFTPSRGIINRFAATIGDLIIAELEQEIRSATIPDLSKRESLLASLAQPVTREALTAHVSMALHAVWIGQSISISTGISIEAGQGEIKRRLISALEGDEDLRSVVGSVPEVVTRVVSRTFDRHRESLSAMIQEVANSLDPGTDMSRRTSINVIIDGAKLARVPESAIQTLKIRFGLRGYHTIPDSDELQIISEDR